MPKDLDAGALVGEGGVDLSAETGHFLEVVVPRRGYDLVVVPLVVVVLQSEVGRNHLVQVLVPIAVVAGVGNFHTVLALEGVVVPAVYVGMARHPMAAWGVHHMEVAAEEHPLLVVEVAAAVAVAAVRDHIDQQVVVVDSLEAVGGTQEEFGSWAVSVSYEFQTRNMSVVAPPG